MTTLHELSCTQSPIHLKKKIRINPDREKVGKRMSSGEKIDIRR